MGKKEIVDALDSVVAFFACSYANRVVNCGDEDFPNHRYLFLHGNRLSVKPAATAIFCRTSSS